MAERVDADATDEVELLAAVGEPHARAVAHAAREHRQHQPAAAHAFDIGDGFA